MPDPLQTPESTGTEKTSDASKFVKFADVTSLWICELVYPLITL